jgi:glycosyltransferase involved in cell wall biosynthesis
VKVRLRMEPVSKAPVKILIVNDYGVLAGGAERISLILREELRKRGHDARLFSSSARPIRASNPADYICFGSAGPSRRLLQVLNPSAFIQLRRVLNDYQPDLVHVRMFHLQLSPFILPLLKGRRCLYHAGTYQMICPISTKLLPDGSTCRFVMGRACYRCGCVSIAGLARIEVQLSALRRWFSFFGRIVANSGWVAERLRADGVRVDEVIRNGTVRRKARPPLTGPPLVAYAGRLVPEKGVEFLLRAMKQVVVSLPESRLRIAGDGPQRSQLQRLVSNLGLDAHVSMVGHLASQQLEESLADVWVNAAPSLYEEPFPNTSIEAMMRGTAVVATSTGGSTEIVRDGSTGYLVAPGETGALAERLLRLLSDRKLAERMGARARKIALGEFTVEQMVDKFLDLYERLEPTT